MGQKELGVSYRVNITNFIYVLILMTDVWADSCLPHPPILLMLMRFFAVTCLALKIILRQKTSVKRSIIMCIAIITIAITAVNTEQSIFVYGILLLIGMVNKNFNEILLINIKLRLLLTAILVTLSSTGVIENRIISKTTGGFAMSLGFSHSNKLALSIFIILLCVVYLKKFRLNLREYAFLLGGFLFVHYITASRTAEITIMVMIIFSLIKTVLYKYKVKLNKSIFISSAVVSYTLIISSFIMPYLYSIGNTIAITLDTVFSGRIFLSLSGLQRYGITIWGQKIKIIYWSVALAGKEEGNAIDNAFVYLLVHFGWVMFILFLICLTYILIKAIKASDTTMVLCFAIIITYATLENTMLYVVNNPFLLYAVSFIANGEGEKVYGKNYRQSVQSQRK